MSANWCTRVRSRILTQSTNSVKDPMQELSFTRKPYRSIPSLHFLQPKMSVAFVVRKNKDSESRFPYEVNLEPLPADASAPKNKDEVLVHILASALNHR